MALYINKQEYVHGAEKPINTPIVHYVADTPDDYEKLPGKETVKPGSTVFCISTGEVRMLGSNGWKLI